MTTTAAILAALDTAILAFAAGDGVASVTVNGRTITYRSLDELTRARAAFAEAEAATATELAGGFPLQMRHLAAGGPY